MPQLHKHLNVVCNASRIASHFKNIMTFDFSNYKETHNLIPLPIEGKEQIYLDLMNIEQSWTGRIDAMFANKFFHEAVQLIINSIALFEKGYFDCAFYSLRQSLEISTTVVYFVDDTETNRDKELKKWKNQEKFPMQGEMLKELLKRQNAFADLRDKMSHYFEEIELIKKKLNKYVHKQGLDKFYVVRNNSINRNKGQDKLVSDFNNFLIKSMGAVAVLRLAIDPFPMLLADPSIYSRTGQLMTEGYSDDFLQKYIGIDNIEAYKQTDLYKCHFEALIQEEEMLPSVLDVVKNDFVDRTKIDEIISQKHLLSNHDTVAVALFSYSEKIAKIYCIGGLHWYFTNVPSKRSTLKWASDDFAILKHGEIKCNVPYDEAFLSYLKIWDEDYYLEHNDKFDAKEIKELNQIRIAHEKAVEPDR